MEERGEMCGVIGEHAGTWKEMKDDRSGMEIGSSIS